MCRDEEKILQISDEGMKAFRCLLKIDSEDVMRLRNLVQGSMVCDARLRNLED